MLVWRKELKNRRGLALQPVKVLLFTCCSSSCSLTSQVKSAHVPPVGSYNSRARSFCFHSILYDQFFVNALGMELHFWKICSPNWVIGPSKLTGSLIATSCNFLFKRSLHVREQQFHIVFRLAFHVEFFDQRLTDLCVLLHGSMLDVHRYDLLVA